MAIASITAKAGQNFTRNNPRHAAQDKPLIENALTHIRKRGWEDTAYCDAALTDKQRIAATMSTLFPFVSNLCVDCRAKL